MDLLNTLTYNETTKKCEAYDTKVNIGGSEGQTTEFSW